jgi:hypothetical protein
MEVSRILGAVKGSFTKWPHFYTAVLCLLYLASFQTSFLFSGDTWAEAFYEYVKFALQGQWEEFFRLGIAGYFNFLPKILSFTYILNGFPLDQVDYFFRISVVMFAISCVSFIAHPFNHSLIKNDWLRVIMAIMTLNLLYHVSAFSFINVWYIGFIPIILITLNPNKIYREWKQVLYAAFAVAVCLTKPSLILAPLVIYRMVRLREWLLGFIILLAITVQTALFLTSEYYLQAQVDQADVVTRLTSLFYGAGVTVFKTFDVYPPHIFFVAIAAMLLASALFVVYINKRRLQAVMLALVFGLFLYIYLYAPDALLNVNEANYLQQFNDISKLQRELIPSFLVLVPFFMCADILIDSFGRQRAFRFNKAWLVIIPMALLAMWQYRPIDALSNKVYMNIDPFRSSLKNHESTCMPVPPTPTWGMNAEPNSSWLYEHYGICASRNTKLKFDYDSFDRPIGEQFDFSIANHLDLQIKSILIPIANPAPVETRTLMLKNIDTNKTYTAQVTGKSNNEAVSFVLFNLAKEGNRSVYNFRLSEQNTASSTLKTGYFKQGGLAYYAYFMPNPNVKDYEHLKAEREKRN